MRILIGIPCYDQFPPETQEDYMRFMYYLGRRTDHEFLLGIKRKAEQFRARNSIVEQALQLDCDYLLFLDDDHVIGWDFSPEANSRYAMVDQFLEHFEADPKLGIVGAVYYHRGADCRPVLMKEGKDGGYYWMRDDEITGGLQEVGVQGGGCMMIRMSIFDRIRPPYFVPETDLGTDIQICKKAREAGYKVACDTSIRIGHVMNQREVVTPQNRHRVAVESGMTVHGADQGIDREWAISSALALYRQDAEEYLGMSFREICETAGEYSMADFDDYEDKRDYYRSKGKEQLARQLAFHHTDAMRQEMEYILSLVNPNADAYGADFGCGSAPVGFELALRGHKMDFIDIDGAGAYEFTKWRAKKRGIDAGFSLRGPYDYVLMLDSIEHIEDWRSAIDSVSAAIKDGGGLVTNFFRNTDFQNKEHISMDHQAVRQHLNSLGLAPVNEYLWIKSKAVSEAA